MSKASGETEPRKPISKEVREARKVLRDADAKLAMTEHADAARAFDKNRKRLRAERLAREAAEPPLPPKKKRQGLESESGPKFPRCILEAINDRKRIETANHQRPSDLEQGDTKDAGTVIDRDWTGVFIKWDNREKQKIWPWYPGPRSE
jgi:hypothetical protein